MTFSLLPAIVRFPPRGRSSRESNRVAEAHKTRGLPGLLAAIRSLRHEQVAIQLAKRVPPPAARLAKRWLVYPRYVKQCRRCLVATRAHGDRYPQKSLFVAGLPKSGTTWLKGLLCSFPGVHEALIPQAAGYELRTGGSHDFELPDDIFDRFRGMLVLTKMHVHGSPHNVEVLRRARLNYVVLYRDLRDVAVSEYFYVRQTPWHPMHSRYRRLGVREGLQLFADVTLPAYLRWVRSWRANRDPELSLEVRYEQLVAHTRSVLTKIAEHLRMPHSPQLIDRIVEEHSFKKLSGGRERGQASSQSFFRSGTSGDWRNHFDDAIAAKFKQVIGEFLVEFGYEKDTTW